jgi:hypothetical protein
MARSDAIRRFGFIASVGDRLLDRFAARVPAIGTACDMGCGPGHVARYLQIGFLESAGFQVGEIIEREPYPGVEHESRRAYIFAEKPPGTNQAGMPSGLPLCR